MKILKQGIFGLLAGGMLFAATPSSTNYGLHNYNFGSGGNNTSSSTNYQLNATTGESSGAEASSTNYKTRSGNNNLQQSDVPAAPTFDNPANYYNRLHFVIIPGTNPSDTLFSIAISSDNFVTTQYVQSDNTVGSVRGIEDYQSYATWGSGTGQLVTGLTPSTTYKIKVNAFQDKFTETEYGPTSTASTVAANITFDIDVAATDSNTSPPYTTSFGSLLPATVVDAAEKVWIDLDTNANNGAKVYVSSTNGGLLSSSKSFNISSATADLSSAASGYGAQSFSVGQTSGGPLTATAPYNVSSQNVGILNSTLREIYSSSLPITAGRGAFILKAKATALTPASGDYQDVLTLTTAASY